MSLFSQNFTFLELLVDRLDEIQEALNDDGTALAAKLRGLLDRASEAPDDPKMTAAIEELIDLLLESNAADLTRELLNQAAEEVGTPSGVTRQRHETALVPDAAPDVDQNLTVPPAGREELSFAAARVITLLPPASEGFTVVPVFYATDRSRIGGPRPSHFYGSDRANLDYGIVKVSIRASIRRAKSNGQVGGTCSVTQIRPSTSR
jgi:hypothetical protein